MDVKEAILNRRSIRNYKDIPIAKDVLIDILVAGQLAPSAGNLQNWRFMIIDDEGLKDSISEACYEQDWMKSAPVFMVICTDTKKIETLYPGHGNNYTIQNASAVAESMTLMATSHGLGSCWVSAINQDKVSGLLNIPPDYEPWVILTLGYPNEKVPMPGKVDLTAITFMNTWGGAGRVNEIPQIFTNFSDIWKSTAKGTTKSISQTIKTVHKHIKNKLKKD